MDRVSMEQLVERLSKTFGSHNLRACDVYHLRVKAGGQWHSVYLSDRRHRMRFHPYGKRKSHVVDSLATLVDKLANYNLRQTDLGRARIALDMASLVSQAERLYKSQHWAGGGDREIVLVDAGWKDGLAKLAFVAIKPGDNGPDVSAGSWHQLQANPAAAEAEIIAYGLSWSATCIVFTDSKNIVDGGQFGERLRWIPREQNRAADKIANRRGA